MELDKGGFEVVRFNVGGKIFMTTKSTLMQGNTSKLVDLLNGKQPNQKDNHGNIFIDRDGELFQYILNFLRSGEINTPRKFENYKALKKEAEFYRLDGEALYEAIQRQRQHINWGYDIIEVRCAKGPSYRSCSVSGLLHVLRDVFPEDGRRLNGKMEVRSSVSYGEFGGRGASLEIPGDFPWSCLYKIITINGFRIKSVGSSSDIPNQACEIWVFVRDKE